jgi:PAS domain S-box-containing protein
MELVLDESTDPIFCIREDGTYLYLNRAFSSAFGREPRELIGLRIFDVFSAEEAEKRMAVVRRAFATGETVVFDVRVPAVDGERFYITSVKPVRTADGAVVAVVCISKEITERKRAELERERLIEALQDALLKVRTLSGLLPICSGCKKIRDDQGYWTQIETYISQHSEADFTHGLCPDCLKVYFPDLDGPHP